MASSKSSFTKAKEKSIEKIVITSKGNKGTSVLYGQYIDKEGTMFTLVNNGRTVVQGELKPTQVQFNIRLEAGRKFELVYDKNDPSESKVADFFLNHPFCEVEGGFNKNFQRDLFLVQFHYQIISDDYTDLMKRLDVANKIMAMSHKEMVDACFALGGDPRNTSPKELVLELIGDTLEGLATDRPDEFLRYHSGNVADKGILINTRKALSYGLITSKSGVYEINGRTIGSTIQDIYNLFASDSDLYNNFIVSQIEKLDAKQEVIADTTPAEVPESLK